MSVVRAVGRERGGRERLLGEARLHLLSREHNARSLAGVLGVSVATTARTIETLRSVLLREGRELVSVRRSGGWHYEIHEEPGVRRRRWERFMQGAGRIRRWRRLPPGKSEDDLIYD